MAMLWGPVTSNGDTLECTSSGLGFKGFKGLEMAMYMRDWTVHIALLSMLSIPAGLTPYGFHNLLYMLEISDDSHLNFAYYSIVYASNQVSLHRHF